MPSLRKVVGKFILSLGSVNPMLSPCSASSLAPATSNVVIHSKRKAIPLLLCMCVRGDRCFLKGGSHSHPLVHKYSALSTVTSALCLPSILCCHSCLESPVETSARQVLSYRWAFQTCAASGGPGPAHSICKNQRSACPHGPFTQLASDSE